MTKLENVCRGCPYRRKKIMKTVTVSMTLTEMGCTLLAEELEKTKKDIGTAIRMFIDLKSRHASDMDKELHEHLGRRIEELRIARDQLAILQSKLIEADLSPSASVEIRNRT